MYIVNIYIFIYDSIYNATISWHKKQFEIMIAPIEVIVKKNLYDRKISAVKSSLFFIIKKN